MRTAILGSAILFLLSGVANNALGEVRYRITDLGTLPGGSRSNAQAINTKGEVVGYAYTGGVDSGGYLVEHTFVYKNGTMTDLNSLPGYSRSSARDINSNGQIAETLDNLVTHDTRAFLYDNGTRTDLGVLPDGSHSRAYGINASGQVVGDAYSASLGWRAVLFHNGTVTDLNSLAHPGSGLTLEAAEAINDNGQITGQATDADGRYHPFLYTDGMVTDLDTLDTRFSVAININASGQVIGYASIGNGHRPFLYSDGTMSDIGTLGGSWGYAYGINANGNVVGMSGISDNSATHAFIYKNGAMTDLNTLIDPSSTWTLQEANDINDAGQIVGTCFNPNGEQHGFLLTPIPEPSSLVLLGVAALGLLGWISRRQRAQA